MIFFAFFFIQSFLSAKFQVKEFPRVGIKIPYSGDKNFQRFLNLFKSSDLKDFFEVKKKNKKELEIFLLNQENLLNIIYEKKGKNFIPIIGILETLNGKKFFGHANGGKNHIKKIKAIVK